MSNLTQTLFPEEELTKKCVTIPTRMLTAVVRIDRLTQLAIERLLVAPDDDALAATVDDLEQVRALAALVLR